MGIVKVLLKQLVQTPATNKFPAKYAPASTIQFLDMVAKGELEMIPPVPVPPGFRGKIAYDRENCTGCQQCYKICPTRAIEWLPEEKKLKVFISRCCFCAQSLTAVSYRARKRERNQTPEPPKSQPSRASPFIPAVEFQLPFHPE